MTGSTDSWIQELQRSLGSEQVIVDGDRLPSYAGDESGVAGTLPQAVVRAGSTEEVVAAVQLARSHGVPITPRGAGTGKAGGCIPVQGGLVIDTTRMNRLVELDGASMVAVAEPGIVTGELRSQIEAAGYFYAPDPNSLATCTLGGNIATNAGGPSSMKYGVTRDHVLGVELVVASGECLQLGRRTLKGVAGYDLTGLVVGSEGTLGIITSANLRLRPLPRALRTILAYFPDVAAAAQAVAGLSKNGVDLRVAELVDGLCLDAARAAGGFAVPEGAGAALLLELDGEREDGSLDAALEIVGECLLRDRADDIAVAATAAQREAIWAVRRDLSAIIKEGRRYWISEDVGVPRARIPALVEALIRARDESGLDMAAYGHAGEGNLHVNILFDDPGQRAAAKTASEQIFRAALDLGGTISAEHGIGLAKRPYLAWEQSAAVLDLQRGLKRHFDPQGLMNPGKVLP